MKVSHLEEDMLGLRQCSLIKMVNLKMDVAEDNKLQGNQLQSKFDLGTPRKEQSHQKSLSTTNWLLAFNFLAPPI